MSKNSDDQNLKALLQQHQPVPPSQSKEDSERVLQAIASELFSSAREEDLRQKSRASWVGWIGAAGFIAATLIGTVMTSRTITAQQSSPVAIVAIDTDFDMGEGFVADNSEDESPALEIGEDWIELVSAY